MHWRGCTRSLMKGLYLFIYLFIYSFIHSLFFDVNIGHNNCKELGAQIQNSIRLSIPSQYFHIIAFS